MSLEYLGEHIHYTYTLSIGHHNSNSEIRIEQKENIEATRSQTTKKRIYLLCLVQVANRIALQLM